MDLILEACIDTLEDAIFAEINGAKNVEVCSSLDLDGLTPSIQLVKEISEKTSLGQNVMIRNRGGDFSYNEQDIQTMMDQISSFRELNIKGFVFGATVIDEYGNTKLDIDNLNRIAEACSPYPLTIHKAIDVCTDVLEECKRLKDSRNNIKFVLSSGGKKTAEEGQDNIKAMQVILSPHINVIAAGKVTSEKVEHLHKYCGVKYFHGRKIV